MRSWRVTHLKMLQHLHPTRCGDSMHHAPAMSLSGHVSTVCSPCRSYGTSAVHRLVRPILPAPCAHQTPTMAEAAGSLQLQSATSAYIHLPFCKRKCWYCDFPVQAVGSKLTSDRVGERMQSYVDQVCREVEATPRVGSAPLQTVYFGGGTPSLVPPALVGRILDTLDRRYGIAAGAEVSLEADPGTFDVARLRGYVALGVTRVSMGVQSFQQELLEACGRSHSLSDVHRAIEAVHSSGVSSWSLDLISGLPHLTLDRWQESLRAALDAQPTHLSVYDLQVEEGTPFARWYAPGRSPLPADEDAAIMYAEASRTLRAAGYEHYEVSNYARPGHRSRHNQVYWSGAPYYAFGQGAASYLSGRRFTRPATIKGYTAWLEGFTARAGGEGDALPGMDLPPQTQEDRMLESIMLRLRTSDGLDMAGFASQYGQDMAARVTHSVTKHVTSGLVIVHREADGQQQQQDSADSQAGGLLLQGSQSGGVVHGQPLSCSGGGGGGGSADTEAMRLDSSSPDRAILTSQQPQVETGTARDALGLPRPALHRHLPPGPPMSGKAITSMRLSDPDGFLLSNDIISDVFAALSDLDK